LEVINEGRKEEASEKKKKLRKKERKSLNLAKKDNKKKNNKWNQKKQRKVFLKEIKFSPKEGRNQLTCKSKKLRKKKNAQVEHRHK